MTLVRWIYQLLRGLVLAVVLLVVGLAALLVVVARRLVLPLGFLLLALIALVALAAAIFEIQGGRDTVSLAHLATLIHLPDLRHYVGVYLGRLEAPGPTAGVSLAAGIGAVVLGLALLGGALIPARQRIVTLASDDAGRVAARRRALNHAAAALAEQPDDVAEARARVRPRRRRAGGRLRLRATRYPDADRKEVEARVKSELAPLTEPYRLSARVRARKRTTEVR